MKEIIPTIVGGIIGILGAIAGGIVLRSFSEWRTFQQEIGLIKDRIEQAKDKNISEAYYNSVEACKRRLKSAAGGARKVLHLPGKEDCFFGLSSSC